MSSGASAATSDPARFYLARWRRGVDDPQAMDSLKRLTGLITDVFAGHYRKYQPAESLVWHNMEVADDAFTYNLRPGVSSRQRAISTFIALAHDVCEDSRKFTPDKPVMPGAVARLWSGTQDERTFIVKVLELKTDAAGLENDARRAAQHQRVMEAREGKHGPAGKTYAEIMAFDKTRNQMSDARDVESGALRFPSRAKGLETVFKKLADYQIVTALPIDPALRQRFYDAHNSFLTATITRQLIPAHNEVTQLRDIEQAQLLNRALAASKGKSVPSMTVQRYDREAGTLKSYMNMDLQQLQEGHRFDSRMEALDYTYRLAARLLTMRKSPATPDLKIAVTKTGNALITQLLYAGSITPTVLAAADEETAEKPWRSPLHNSYHGTHRRPLLP